MAKNPKPLRELLAGNEHTTPPKFLISSVTTFNEEEELWETKVGTDGKDMPLIATFYGKTERESRRAAGMFVCGI